MTNNLTEELGGMQNIVCGVIEPGDKATFHYHGERCIELVDESVLVGMDVEMAEAVFQVKIYRKLPVVHQGDLDHITPVIQKPLAFEVDSVPEHYIPQDSAERKTAPMFRGLLGYFPAALFEVARHSFASNEKHNPGEDLHWARGKSADHADCIVRHLIDAGDVNTAGRLEHLRALAWRSLALLQEECENQGAKPGVSSRHD